MRRSGALPTGRRPRSNNICILRQTKVYFIIYKCSVISKTPEPEEISSKSAKECVSLLIFFRSA